MKLIELFAGIWAAATRSAAAFDDLTADVQAVRAEFRRQMGMEALEDSPAMLEAKDVKPGRNGRKTATA